MGLESLEIRDVRNIAETSLSPGPQFNLIVGPNGSGKTSLLESIYLLGRGRSFRSARIEPVVRSGAEHLQVFGRYRSDSAPLVSMGIERGRSHARIRIDGNEVKNLSALAERLPLQVITPESHRLMESGPRKRRQFVDWALFHVEHRFRRTWQDYHRALRQRNAWLRAGARGQPVWDLALLESAGPLHRLRVDYIERLSASLTKFADQLLGLPEIGCRYVAGWGAEPKFSDGLARSMERDRRQGTTHVGPHRADIVIERAGEPLSGRVSRGQQKLLVAALNLAQAELYSGVSGSQCVVLVDDLPAELDRERRQALFACLDRLGSQVFITTTDSGLLEAPPDSDLRWFHVEHGNIRSESP